MPLSVQKSTSPLLSEITAEFLIVQIEIGLTLLNLSSPASGSEYAAEYSEAAQRAYQCAQDRLSESVLTDRHKESVNQKLILLKERLISANAAHHSGARVKAMAAGK